MSEHAMNDETRHWHMEKPGFGKSGPERGCVRLGVGQPGVGCPESPERGRLSPVLGAGKDDDFGS